MTVMWQLSWTFVLHFMPQAVAVDSRVQHVLFDVSQTLPPLQLAEQFRLEVPHPLSDAELQKPA